MRYLRVLEIIKHLLETDSFLTKRQDICSKFQAFLRLACREIYYKDVELFHNQTTVDKIIEDVSSSLSVPRPVLHITASGKSLFFGEIEAVNMDGSVVSGFFASEGTLIPALETVQDFNLNCEYILVVEKDCIFQWLVSKYSSLCRYLGKKVLLVTGKGYPCLRCKEFLSLLSKTRPDINLFCLVDFDPYGYEIFSTYKFGSKVSCPFNYSC